MRIPNAVLYHFAADPIGPMLNFEREAESRQSSIRSEIEEFLSSIDPAIVGETQRDRRFQWLHSGRSNLDRAARIWVAEQSLSKGIAAYRLSVLRQDSESDRPRPYDHPALEDLTPDTEHLVPLREFDFDGSRLLRNGHAFLVLGTQRSPNSTYWLLGGLYSNLRDHVRVRLDPLLHGPASNFGPLHQRMLVYGRSLDWHRIEGIRETDHGRWCPDSQERGSHFTDYAWEPRGSEVTFVCEEVPKLEAAAYEPGRYLHAIYLPSKAAIFHLDGAVRIYTNSEITERHAQHVRKAGKIGLRKKIFRVDDLVPRDVLSSLCQAFFVWNEDVCRYFAAGCKRVA